jgi:arylformamidase
MACCGIAQKDRGPMKHARRHALLGATASLASLALRRPAQAEDRVFLNYTQAELDKAYDQAAWAPSRGVVIARYASDSEAVRRASPPRTERYGDTEAEVLDIFTPPNPGRAPIHVFIHGGAWVSLTKNDAEAAAPAFTDLGAIYVALNFANVPAVRVPDMAEQCRKALRWIYVNAAKFGGNADAIHLSGHSSGGHLAGVMLTTDWTTTGHPANLIKSAVLMSGIYDLYPAMLSSRRNYLKLSPEEVVALSPLRHLERFNCPVEIANGDLESPEFKRQSLIMGDALAGMGLLRGRHILFNTNHFEVPEQLKRSDTVLGRAAMQVMGLI